MLSLTCTWWSFDSLIINVRYLLYFHGFIPQGSMEMVGNLSVFFTAVSDRYKCLSVISPMSWWLEFCNKINDIKPFILFDIQLFDWWLLLITVYIHVHWKLILLVWVTKKSEEIGIEMLERYERRITLWFTIRFHSNNFTNYTSQIDLVTTGRCLCAVWLDFFPA